MLGYLSLLQPFLESRQSNGTRSSGAGRVCFSRFWNQGKAAMAIITKPTQFASAVFGIKAKQPELLQCDQVEFASAVFGIKAKQGRSHQEANWQFASAVFGIKAKPPMKRSTKL